MKMILNNLKFLFMPSYWVMNYPYSKEVDEIINELLDKYEFSDLDDQELTCKLGKATIWVGNIPSASIRLYGTGLEYYRPSRETIFKALNKFNSFKKHTNTIRLKEKVELTRREIF